MPEAPQVTSYRNSLYQGPIAASLRQGFGLAYTLDSHCLIGSHWTHDQPNNHTFIFYNHSSYVYGYWQAGLPHGFNTVRMDKMVIMGWYERGQCRGRILVVFEQYSLAVVLEVAEGEGREVAKGQIYSDDDFDRYIAMCQWPQFHEEWKTLIKFMSAYMVAQEADKTEIKPKLRLVNQSYYRYGYDQGLAIVFDDDYRIVSAGMHRKAKLKSLGVRFTKGNFVEEGNFGKDSEVFAYNYTHRPEGKIGKLYSNYVLKSLDFVNNYIHNPASELISSFEQLVRSALFRKLLAGQITERKPTFDSTTKQGQSPKPEQPSKTSKVRQQSRENMEQQRVRLQNYRKQIFESINKRSMASEGEVKKLTPQKVQPSPIPPPQQFSPAPIINKPPVQLFTREKRRSGTIKSKSRTRSRSPIFTPEKANTESRSNVSPFNFKMKARIFKDEKPSKYTYQPLMPEDQHNNPMADKYASPHEQMQFSRTKNQGVEGMLPLSVKRDSPLKQHSPEGRKKVQQLIERPSPQRKSPQRPSPQKPKMKKRDNNEYLVLRTNPRPSNYELDAISPNLEMSTPYKKSPSRLPSNPENRSNNVYLGRVASTADSPPRREIKGRTYLQNHRIARAASPDRNPDPLPQAKIERRYGPAIRGYSNGENKSNQVYTQGHEESVGQQRRVKVHAPERMDNKRETETTPMRKKYSYMYDAGSGR